MDAHTWFDSFPNRAGRRRRTWECASLTFRSSSMGGLRLSCVADPLPIELRESEGCAQCLGSVSALSIGPFPRLIDEPDENRSHTQRWITLLMQYGSEGRAIGKKWSHFRERLPRNQKKIHSAHCEMNVPVQSQRFSFVSFLLQQNNTVRVVSPFSNWFTRHEDKREKKKYCIYRLTAGLAWIYGGGSARARPKAFPPTHTEEKNK